jgi:hypothetical protein
MNLRKISLYCSIKERFILFIINLPTVTFGLFSCIILLLAHVDCNYFEILGYHIHYSASILTEKAKHRSRFHIKFFTTFGTLDTTFAIQISVILTLAHTLFRGVGYNKKGESLFLANQSICLPFGAKPIRTRTFLLLPV